MNTKFIISSFFVFLIIYVAFFMSSVGLVNSGDAPQYFTTEALLINKNVDVAPFDGDPHYFMWPDYVEINGQRFGMRGYMMSMFMIPAHYVSSFLQGAFSIDNFPPEVSGVENFRYELSVVTLFTLFSVLGIFFVWKIVQERTKNLFIANVVALLMAFGTFVWKYSSYYSRQGFQVFLVGLSAYSFSRMLVDKKNKYFWYGLLYLVWIVSYGVDSVYFVILGLWLFGYGLWELNTLFPKRKKLTKHVRKFFIALIPAVVLGIISLSLNLHWYETAFPSLHTQNIVIKEYFKGPLLETWLSAPLTPTVYYMLFGNGQIHPDSFRHFANITEEVFVYASVKFAQTYNFYGIFVVSPFLLLSLLGLGKFTKEKRNLIFSFFMFIGGILLTTKIFSFWGGNQYDVRYFYPYVFFLVLPLGLGLQYVSQKKSVVTKIGAWAALMVMGAWSVFMGWLGVINMFKAAQTGERRIWVEPPDFFSMIEKTSTQELLDATFLNRANWGLAIMTFAVLYGLSYGIAYIYSSWQKKK